MLLDIQMGVRPEVLFAWRFAAAGFMCLLVVAHVRLTLKANEPTFVCLESVTCPGLECHINSWI